MFVQPGRASFGVAFRPAPRPVLPTLHQPGADWVVENVVGRRGEMVLVADDPRGKPLGEEVTTAAVARVVLSRVDAVQPAKCLGEVSRGALDDQVVVRSHQAVRMDA